MSGDSVASAERIASLSISAVAGSSDAIFQSHKRLFDLSLVILSALFVTPLILATTFALLLLQGRPVLIRHKRVGRDGKEFPCLKFRTMVTNAEDVLRRHLSENVKARTEWQKTFKLKDDPRVTWLGKFLRKSSLDELPQLWNILKGDMSIVGPRPIVQAEVSRYGSNIKDYHQVKPGLTGLWQVSGRSDIDYEERVKLDVAYVRSLSIFADLKIVAKTIPAVVRSRGSY